MKLNEPGMQKQKTNKKVESTSVGETHEAITGLLQAEHRKSLTALDSQ